MNPFAQTGENSNIVFDTLSGTLPSLVKAKKNPYIVTNNIEVPFNKTITIEPGTIFLFKNFAGLHIRGRLIALGTENKPIVFSSEFDKKYNPNLYGTQTPLTGMVFTLLQMHLAPS